MKGFVFTPVSSDASSNAQNRIASFSHRLMGSFLVFGLIAGLVTLSTEEVKAQCNLLNETFNVNPVLSPTNVDGAWYPDRYPPAGFSSGTIGGSDALKISISAADGAQNRPPAYSGQFYNTQGRKLNQCGKCVTSVKGDIWIPADWATKHRRTDMWATAFDISDAISAYPIIGFANVDGASPTLRYWDGAAWVNVAGLAYDTWITLEASLSGGNIVYKVNGTTVGTIASASSVYYGNIIMQAYNFNDNTLPPSQYDPSADNTYDAWWDNLITNGVTGGNVVKNLTTNKSFCSLQEAIDDAATLAGHTLKLEGNLSEDLVVVNKAVIIDGDGKTLTSTSSATYGIEVAVPNVTIQNLTVFDATTFGIQVDCDAHNLVMTNVTVNSSGASGIGINGSDNVVLTNLTTTNNVGNGLSITDCNNLTINGFTSSGNAFSPAFSAGIGLFTSGVYCPPAGINGFTLTGTVSIAEPVKVYSQKTNANDVITGISGASIDWAVGVGALNKSYWQDQATAYAVAAASFDAPFSYSNTLVYVEDIATGNFYVDDDPAGDASTPMTVQAAVDYIGSGKTIFLEDGAYNQRVTISKSLTLDGNGALNSVLFGTGLSSGASGITINSGVTNVTIQDLAVTQYTGSTPNTTGGIYAAGGNNNLTIKNCDVYNNPNCSGIYVEGNANISDVLIDNVKSFGHGAPGNPARGIVIWNGVKSNITIQNCEVYNNNCCGIELQDGSATGITIKNNNVHDNSDSGISPIGLSGPGANLIENNTVTNNGRFGIEVKLPNGSGATSGAGSIVLQGNTVTRTVSIIPENRDIAGISVYRRGALSTGNVNIPTGVVIQNNTVSGYSQPSASDGFGIVVEGTNHIVQNNTVSNNNVGIQQQAGHTPYVENVGGTPNDGDQSNLSDQYFGRGNAPFTCGNVITGNTFSGNTTNTRNVGAGVNTLAGVVFNTSTGETFCSIQTAIDDSNTASGNTITANPGTFVENVSLNKTLTLKGAKQGVDARGRVSGSPNPAVESVIAPASGKALDLLSGTGASTIDGFSMVSAPASGTAGVISSDVAATDGLQLKNNYIAVSSGSGAALWLNKNAIDANIENNEFTGATGSTQVVFFDGGDQFHGLYFRNNNVLRSGAVGNTGIFVDGNRNIGTSVSSRTPQIKGNLFQGHALGLNGGSRSFENAEISENTFNGNTGGMAAGPKASSIVRNTFSNNTGYGLRLTSFGNTSDPTRGAQNSTVQNNFFSGNGTTVDMTNGYGDLRIDNQYTGVVATNTISDNSFGSTIALFNNETGGELVNAECNWFGSASAATVTGKIINQTGAFTDATPWLTNGTDNDVLTAGFQPVPLSCTGYPVHNLTQSTDYSTIQAAINAANPGDVIECDPFTYVERVTIDKTLTLQGTSETACILSGTGLSGTGRGITIADGVTGVTIKKLTIQNFAGADGNTDAGIYAIGGNNNLTVQNVTIQNNVGGSGFYANGPVTNVLLDYVTSSGHTTSARGIVIWNGFKSNITITNCHVFNNNCCGIELQDGTASGVTMTGNNVHDNADNGIGLSGLKGGTGANLIANNTLNNNGRFGIEVKNPNGTGQTSGTGSIVVENNTVNFTASPTMNNRDHAGIAVFRRAFLSGNSAGYPNIPTGVVVRNNTVAGYKQLNPGSSEKGYGIVIEGTNHSVLNNAVNNNDFGIQEQGGLHPNANYVPDDAGDGDQGNGQSANYFGRGNAPVACGNTISGNTFSGNTTNTNTVVGGNSYGLVVNTSTGETFCSINAAIADAQTVNGNILTVGKGTFPENVTVNKSLTLNGFGNNSAPASNTVLSAPSSCSGTGFAVSAANVTLNNMYVTGYSQAVQLLSVSSPTLSNLNLVDYCLYGVNLSGSNSTVNITNTSMQRTTPLAGTVGLRTGTADATTGLTIDGCTITGNTQGIYTAQATTPAAFTNIMIKNSTISNNTQKGMYFEKLNNATLENLTMDNNGTDATYGFNNGIDINLKYGSYSNITIQNCDITNSGYTGTATDPENPAAIAIKARDDAPSYNSIPATLTGLTIKNNKITGPRNGIRFGEFGKVNNGPANVTVEGNDLSYAFGHKTIVRRTNDDVNLLCNWHGTTDLPTILATISNAGSGSTILSSILGTGADGNPAVGFQPSGSCTCPSGNLVTNTNTTETFCTIQAAIDDPQTLDGHILTASAGTYIENITVTKAVKLRGAQYGVSPNPSRAGAESIIVPAVSDPDPNSPTSTPIMYLTAAASGAEIDGFTFDGDNPNLTSAVNINGANIDAIEALGGYDGLANVTVANNIIKNLNYAGIDFYNYNNGGASTTGNAVSNNKFDNIIPASFGIGVLIYNNCYTDITDNVMTRVRVGIQTGNFYQADAGSSHDITGNNIESSRRGIYFNLHYSNSANFNISNNNFTNYAGEPVSDGILVSSIQSAVGATISNNNVTGNTFGVALWNCPTSNTITIQGGTLSGNKVGVFATNYYGPNNGDAASSAYALDGVNILNSLWAGVEVSDTSANTNGSTVSMSIGGNTTINNTTRGLLIQGADASASFTGPAAASFTSQARYIDQISNGANVPATNINATTVNFDGQTGATASLAQNFAIEDKIVHKIDNSALGFVLVKANNDFVTANSFSTPNTTPSIQRGVDAASAGFTVNVGPGTFVEDVNVNKQLTLLGSGYLNTTVSGAIGGAGSTFQMNAAGIVFDGFTVTREGNNTTDWNNPGLNTAGIAIQGQSNYAEIRNSKFTGNRTGIDVNNSNGNNIHNNIITFNRTGLIFRNQTDNTNLTENEITDNWTVGVLFLDGSGGTNSPVQQAINSTFNNNDISDNWYGQIVDRQSGGSLPAPGTLLKNFDCNWYGTTAPIVSTANSAEPGYAAQIPVAYGGSATPPGGSIPHILGPASANFDYISWLVDGTDNQPATTGFQPVPSMCLGTPVVITLTLQTNVSCFGGNDGALDITPSGGSGNYSYAWSNLAITQDISGLTAGTYSVTVTDVTYLGTATATYTITEPTVLTATAGNNGPIYAGATLNLTSTPAGGTPAYTYSWTGPNGFSSTDQNPSILNATVAANGSYSVTVTDMKGCMTVTSTTAIIYGPALYVNDNSLTGDHYTTATGSNSNPGTPSAPFATLTYAISIAQPGNTIYVDAGTYVENPTVNKSLTILGSNAGVSGTGARTYAESTVQTNGSQNAVFTVSASNVILDGFFIEGNDPLVTGSPVHSGDDANVFYNIFSAAGNNQTFRNNIMARAAIGVRGDHAANGNLIDNNWFDAIGVFDFGYAVTLRTNYYADVTNNKMTRVWTGLHTNNHNGAGGPASWSFSNNQVSSYAGGLWYNLQYNSATPLTINNNQFSAEAGAVTNNYGVQFVSIQDAVNPVFTNNTITGTDYGFIGWNISTSNTVTLGATNTITGAKKAGIYFTNNLAFNPVGTTVFGSGAAASTLNVAGIGINPAATGTGIALEGTGANAATLNFTAPTTLNGGATGLSATGSASAITGNSLANVTFTGQSGDYITLSNNAFTTQQLDATASLFDGTTGAGKTNAQLFATEDKITHRIEDKNLGFVLVKTANAYVTDIDLTATPTNNDYTRIRNAVELVANNWSINLKGTFDWTLPFADNSWSLGNDDVLSTGDDRSIVVPANLNGVTFTAPDGLGTASIQGPGDIAAANLEGVLVFDGGDNQNWTISNLEFLNFDMAIGMFFGAGGVDAFNGTTITNNHILIATDLNTVDAPADVNQNIGIHYAFGVNQTISNNVIDIPGDGVSNGTNYSTSVGMQSNTSGGNVYNGLTITGNTINILNPQSANPQVVLGIWENAHAHSSNITVSNNQFLNLAVGNNPATNLQRGFRVTSHSSASTTVSYSGNTVKGANIGFQWISGSNFAGNQPIVVANNTLNNNAIGFLVQSNGLATFTGNDFDDATDNTVDLQIQPGSVVTSGGGNQWAGNNYYVENLAATPLDIIGETYDESNNFRRSDRIYDALDNAASGLVRFLATDHYVSTPGTGSADETIQRAVNAASAGHTIYVEAGTYAENVTVNKDLTLLGPNAGINPNTGTRVAEAIVVPAVNNLTNGRVFDLTADGITIDGFTVDGDNLLVTGGTSLNGADINATAGIASGTYSGTDGNNNLLITNNILKNFDNDLSSTAAIYGNGSQTVAKTGNVISNNKIDNSNIWAIIAEANFYADITGNVITKANRGIQTDGFWLAGTPVSISNNTISYYKRGITLNNYWGATSLFTVSNNTIQPETSGNNEDGGAGAATPNRGIAVWSMYNTVGGVNLTDNTITGAYYGEELWNNAPGKVTQTGGTITNANVGIYLPTNQSSWGNAGYGSNASVTAVTITNPTTDGVYLQDNSSGAGASIDFTLTNAFVTGGVNGIHADGDEITAEIHDNSITGASAKAIDASAYTGATALDAECNWYGVTAASAVAARISGNVDYTTWLINGTDDQPLAQGFQPVAGACDGEPISISVQTDPVTCGETEGSITVDFMGGTPPYTLSWSGTESGSMSGLTGPPQTISNLSPGPYTITVTDTYGSSAMTSVTVDYLPVTNVTQTLYFATIQAAINNAAAGDVIEVCKGAYPENILIDKSLTLNGPQDNVDADTRFAAFVSGPNGPKADPNVEAIITAPLNNPTGGNPNANDLIRVTASGVTINGFVIDGNNPDIAGASAVQTSGIDIDARRGITNVGANDGLNPVNNLQVKYNIIQNVAQRGVSLANGGPVSTGNAITENVIRNFGSDPVNGGQAVILFTNAYADVTNNTIDVPNDNIGLHLQNFYSNGSMNWTGNTIMVGQDAFGIHANLFYAPSATLTIANNTVNARAGVTGTSDYTWGINVWSVQVGSTVALNNNTVGASGGQFGRGINLWNLPTSNTVSVSGGTVGNAVVGINLDNIDPYYGGASGTVVNVSGTSVSNTTIGLRARADVLPVAPLFAANTVSGNVTLNISGVTVDGGTHGIQAVAPAASAPYTATVVVNNDSEVKNATVAGILASGGQASATVQNNDASIFGNPIGIDVDGGTATVQNNHIYDNGIGVRFTNGGTGTVNNGNNFDGGAGDDNGTDIQLTASAGAVLASPNNSFAGDTYGVQNLTAATVDATNCYWESATGPGPVGPGSGANVTSLVNYCPWLDAPNGTPVTPTVTILVDDASGTTPDDGIICIGDAVSLDATTPGATAYAWDNALPANATQIGLMPAISTTYNVTVTVPGCSITDAQLVQVDPLPSATITAAAFVCGNSTGNTASVPDAGMGATYNWSIANGSITAGAGTNSVTYTAGMSGSVTFNVTVTSPSNCTATGSLVVQIDNTAPTITCVGPVTVNTDPGQCTAVVNGIAPASANDACPYTITYAITGTTTGSGNDDASGTTFNQGVSTVTYTILDASGNSANCAFTVTVNDAQLPTISCPTAATVGILAPRDPYATGWATGADNCGTVTITYNDDRSGLTGCNATGTIVRTFTAKDASNNAQTCAQTITVQDLTPPVLSACPTDITVNVDPMSCSAVVTYTDPTAVDAGYFQGFENAAYASGTFPNAPSTDWNEFNSKIARASSGTDGITSKTGTAHGVINSTTLPAPPNDDTGIFSRLGGYSPVFGSGFRSAQDIYIDLSDPAVVANTYGWDLSTAASNQSNGHLRDFIFHAASNASGEVLIGSSNGSNFTRRNDLASINHYTITGSGWYTFEWVFRNNAGVLAVDLNLRDAGGALLWTNTLSNPGDLIATNVGGNRYMWFTFLEVNKLAIDNSTLERNASVACVMPSGSTFNLGTTSVTCTATDACTNTSTCSFNVTVVDNIPPAISCPANIVVNAASGTCGAVVTYTAPVGTDNCMGPVTTQTDVTGLSSGSTFPVGTTTLQYTVVDGASLSSSCQFTVTVNDAEQPTISCPATANLDILDPRDPYATGWATGADNCGTVTITYNDDRSGLNVCNATGSIVRTFTATDASNNTKTCQQTINVVDNTDPVLSACPTDITVDADPNTCSVTVTYTDPTAVDLGYFQGFENAAYASGTYPNAPSTDWNEYNSKIARASSGTDGITSKTGTAHGVINSTTLPAPPNDDTGIFSRLGGYSPVFGTGFRTAQDIYIDVNDPAVLANTYGWDLSTAVSNQSNAHRRDFVFHSASNASGEVLIGSSNGSNFTRRNDLASINHYTITSSGWYTFEWVFRNNGSGVLAVDLNLRDAGGALLWTNTLSDPSDLIATNVGGNRYMWFTFLEVNKLAIDNSTLERNASVACVMPSGSTFNVGTTSVTCTATDACTNTSTCSFNVIVNPVDVPAVSVAASATTICAGTNVTFTATPTFGGATPSYQWYLNSMPVGTNSPTYSNNSLANGDQVHCVMTTSYTCPTMPTATSNTVTMTVNPLPSAPNTTGTSCSGTAANFDLQAHMNSMGNAVGSNYSWYALSNNPQVTGESLTPQTGDLISDLLVNTSNLPQSVVYRVTPTSDPQGCLGANFDVTITVNPVPTAATTDNNDPFCSGGATNITVTNPNSVAGTTYNWSAPATPGIAELASPAGANGVLLTTPIAQALTNTTGSPINVTFTVTPVGPAPTFCAGTPVTQTVTVNPTPTGMISASASPVCAGSPVNLSFTPAGGVGPFDIVVNGTTYPNVTGGVFATVNPVTTTTYTLTSITDKGVTPNCTNSSPASAVTVTVNPLPTAAIAVAETSGTANNDGVICTGASVTLTASGGATYLWSTTDTDAAITVSPTSTTTYTVTVTDGNGCQSNTQVVITVNPLPTAAIAVAETSGTANNDGTICNGASVTLTASGGATYLWSTTDTDAAITVSPTSTTTYTVTVTNANGCVDVESVTITVNPLPTAAIAVAETSGTTNNDGSICTGASVTLTASGGGTYLWDDASTDATLTVSPTSTTTYAVTVTNANGCTDVESVTITVNPLPTAAIALAETSGTPNDGTVCTGDPVTLTASGGATYLWSTTATDAAITVNPTSTTTYTVTVTSAAGCIDVESVVVTVISCGEITGKAIWEADDVSGIKDVVVSLTGDDTDTYTTAADGLYTLVFDSGSSFTVTPKKNKPMPFALNGVSSADASRIQQHVTGAFPLTDPYKLIAADVNKNNNVTSQDASLITQAILGSPVAQALFINTTWRFVPAAYVFPVPTSPWGFPETITLTGGASNQNFIGCKLGDVNNTANPLNTAANAPELVWTAEDRLLQQGDEFSVDFKAAGFNELLALQFALRFDPEQLQLLDIETLAGSPLQDGNFGTWNLANGEIRAAMALTETTSLPNGAPGFRLRFKALESGQYLSDVLRIAHEVLNGEAYTADYTPGPVSLAFDGINTSTGEPLAGQFQLLQNQPNPFRDQTLIGFILPEGCETQLRVFDPAGRLVAEQKGWFAKGYNNVTFDLGGYGGQGVLYYELTTPYGTLARKMVLVRE